MRWGVNLRRALGLLLASAVAAPVATAQEVAILCAGGDPNFTIRDGLMCTGNFVKADIIDTSGVTPSLLTLQNYHAVLVCNIDEQPHADAVSMGDLLADFVEAGGGVVLAGGSFYSPTTMAGRLVTDGLLPMTQATGSRICPGGLTLDPKEEMFQLPGARLPDGIEGHPILYGVNTSDGGLSCHASGLAPVAGAEYIADWSNGAVAVTSLETDPTFGKVVGLNVEGPNTGGSADGWVAGQDFDNLLGNALLYSAGFSKPAGTCYNDTLTQDLNCNGIDESRESLVDLADPVCSATVNPETGLPFENNDYFFDHITYGCEIPILDQEVDFDMLTGFVPPFGPGIVQAGGVTALLVCDNCSTIYNPDQADIDCDNVGDLCDNCPYISNEDQANGCPFPDGDCFGNACDNCPCVANPDQQDQDNDGLGDACDNCPTTFNPDQADSDPAPGPLFDFAGDVCDNCPDLYNPGQADTDNDGVGDLCDNCPQVVNPSQDDVDEDGIGDACDICPLVDDGLPIVPGQTTAQPDVDEDDVGDICDNCLNTPNFDQLDMDLDLVGDACDICPLNADQDQEDGDEDGFGDACDNCPTLKNIDQLDADGDLVGDLCDSCINAPNPDQLDEDDDGLGDACDLCPGVATTLDFDTDGDGWGDACDNCPRQFNADQVDSDGDGSGDACDLFVLRGGGQLDQGCSTVGSAAPAALIPFVMLAALRRRRKGRSWA